MDAINSLGINGKLLIAQILNFVILLLLLKKFLYNPIVKMLDNRSQTIKKSLDDAKKIEEELKKTEEKNQEIITAAQAEAKKMVEEAKKNAADEGKRILNEATKQAEAQKTKAVAEITREKESAKNEIKKEAAELIALAASKVLQTKIDQKTDKSLIEEAIKRINK